MANGIDQKKVLEDAGEKFAESANTDFGKHIAQGKKGVPSLKGALFSGLMKMLEGITPSDSGLHKILSSASSNGEWLQREWNGGMAQMMGWGPYGPSLYIIGSAGSDLVGTVGGGIKGLYNHGGQLLSDDTARFAKWLDTDDGRRFTWNFSDLNPFFKYYPTPTFLMDPKQRYRNPLNDELWSASSNDRRIGSDVYEEFAEPSAQTPLTSSATSIGNYLPYLTNQASYGDQPWFWSDYGSTSRQDDGWSFSQYMQTLAEQTSNASAPADESFLYTDPPINSKYRYQEPLAEPSLPSGVGSYMDFGGYSFPESPSQPPPNDNIEGWDVSHMIDRNVPWYFTPSDSSPQSDSSSQKPQLSPIDYAGSAIGTAYNILSYGSTLQDVLTGRRSDPGAYLSLANSTAQGLSWLGKTDAAKEIVGAIGDLQTPLDTMAGVTGGAVSGWGLYQNIAGLANGEATAQSVLGKAKPPNNAPARLPPLALAIHHTLAY